MQCSSLVGTYIFSKGETKLKCFGEGKTQKAGHDLEVVTWSRLAFHDVLISTDLPLAIQKGSHRSYLQRRREPGAYEDGCFGGGIALCGEEKLLLYCRGILSVLPHESPIELILFIVVKVKLICFLIISRERRVALAWSSEWFQRIEFWNKRSPTLLFLARSCVHVDQRSMSAGIAALAVFSPFSTSSGPKSNKFSFHKRWHVYKKINKRMITMVTLNRTKMMMANMEEVNDNHRNSTK